MNTFETTTTTTKIVPGSVQREGHGKPSSRTLVPEPLVDRETRELEIARLAYLLWEKRGGPLGSPEEDWFKAEQLFRGA